MISWLASTGPEYMLCTEARKKQKFLGNSQGDKQHLNTSLSTCDRCGQFRGLTEAARRIVHICTDSHTSQAGRKDLSDQVAKERSRGAIVHRHIPQIYHASPNAGGARELKVARWRWDGCLFATPCSVGPIDCEARANAPSQKAAARQTSRHKTRAHCSALSRRTSLLSIPDLQTHIVLTYRQEGFKRTTLGHAS